MNCVTYILNMMYILNILSNNITYFYQLTARLRRLNDWLSALSLLTNLSGFVGHHCFIFFTSFLHSGVFLHWTKMMRVHRAGEVIFSDCTIALLNLCKTDSWLPKVVTLIRLWWRNLRLVLCWTKRKLISSVSVSWLLLYLYLDPFHFY